MNFGVWTLTLFLTTLVVLSLCVGGPISQAAEPASSSASQTSSSETANLALGRPYAITASWPDPLFVSLEAAYPDTDNKELTDGRKGKATYSDTAWQGFTRQAARRIRVDLGQISTVNEVMGRFLQSKSAGVMVPRYLRVSLSTDGERWVPVGDAPTQVGPWNTITKAEEIKLSGLNHEVRYVQVEFPVDVIVMMDEIEVHGVTGLRNGATRLADVPVDPAAPTDRKYAALRGAEWEPKPGFVPAGSEGAGGARHVVLLTYAYPPNPWDGEWSPKDYLPYVAYLSEEGKPQDWMFDTLLLAPQSATLTNHKFHGVTLSDSTDKKDWEWYLDETFRPGLQLDALEEAARQAKEALGDPNHKVKVLLTLVNASPAKRAFGDVDGDGKVENFDYRQVGRETALANRVAAERWLVSEFLRRWKERGYKHMELIGFWWHPEYIGFAHSPDEDQFVREVGKLVREQGLKFYWIPFYGSEGSYDWFNYGFDAAMLQPNYMFTDADEGRLKITADIAKAMGMGVEMEKHWNSGYVEMEKWLNYLTGGVKYGYMNTLVGYYQGFKDFGRAATSDRASRRLYYDFVYQFIKGKYDPSALPSSEE